MKEEMDFVVWKLKSYNLTHNRLIMMLDKKGIIVSKENLSLILRGIKRGTTASQVLATSMNILLSYEEWMAKM